MSDLELLAVGFKRGTVVPALLWFLIFCSIVSWAIIARTWLSQRREKKGYRQTRAQLDATQSADWARILSTNLADDGASRIVNTAVRQAGPDASTKSLDSIRISVKSAVVSEIERLQLALPLLATISTVSPYLGLFGTVWGVMDAFGAFGGLEEQASFTQVAPGIAQALVATGMGLAVAIPAATAYNLFLARAGRIADNFDLIGEELVARLDSIDLQRAGVA